MPLRKALTVLLLTATAASAGCATSASSNDAAPIAPAPRTFDSELPPRPAAINHFVEFKLLNPADADELIADCDRFLATIPGVVSYFAGKPHDTGRADRVYGDYHVGFFVGFESDEDYAVYVDHPDHIRVVEKWRPRLVRLRVFDVWDDGSRDGR